MKNSKTSTTLTNNHKTRNRNENFGFFNGVNPILLEHSENVKLLAGQMQRFPLMPSRRFADSKSWKFKLDFAFIISETVIE